MEEVEGLFLMEIGLQGKKCSADTWRVIRSTGKFKSRLRLKEAMCSSLPSASLLQKGLLLGIYLIGRLFRPFPYLFPTFPLISFLWLKKRAESLSLSQHVTVISVNSSSKVEE